MFSFVSIRRCLLPVVLILFAPFASSRAASARNYVVDRFDDSLANLCTALSSDCGLRGAIIAANALPGADTIHLAAGTYELSRLTGTEAERGDLDITDELTIVGVGPLETTVDANGIDRVFDIDIPYDPDVLVRIERLEITGGFVPATIGVSLQFLSGAGVRVWNGQASIELCEISGNSTVLGWGGGVYQQGEGQAMLVSSVIRENSAADGGAMRGSLIQLESCAVFENLTDYGGALSFTSQGWIANTSIGFNLSSSKCDVELAECGAILVSSGAESVGIAYSTIQGNEGHQLVSLVSAVGQAFPPVQVLNTVLIGSCWAPLAEGIVSDGGNVESPGDTCLFGDHDLVNVADAKVAPALGYHGGPTPVFMLLPGSPAIDFEHADDACRGADERAALSPADGDGAPPTHCDSGAVEIQAPGDLFVENFESALLSNWWAPNP